MSTILGYSQFISEQVRKERGLGLRQLEESENDHIMVSHPIETLHSGDNKNRTGKHLTNNSGDFTKEYHDQDHHFKQIITKLKQHKQDRKVHDGHEDPAGHVTFKKGSKAHKAVEQHLQHVDHQPTTAAGHKHGPRGR